MACLLLEMAVLPQSRGAVVGLAAGMLTYVALTDERWPAIIALGALGLITGISWPVLDAVYQAPSAPDLAAALADARLAIAAGVAAAFAVGLAVGMIGRPLRRALGLPRAHAAGRYGFAALSIVLVAVVVTVGDPRAWAREGWEDFSSADAAGAERAEQRLGGSLASGRSDLYRVAVRTAFADHPLQGVGGAGFPAHYLLERRIREAPDDAHSLILSQMAELGAVGALTFAACCGVFLAIVIHSPSSNLRWTS